MLGELKFKPVFKPVLEPKKYTSGTATKNTTKLTSLLNRHGYNPFSVGYKPVVILTADDNKDYVFRGFVLSYNINGEIYNVTPDKKHKNGYFVRYNNSPPVKFTLLEILCLFDDEKKGVL
ncbi:hypothetical protein HNP86_001796 [Methanococcus maripaludis]|uniref:Uncharacterized protein n=1 Tax=Methanococcus maripaludis TaxID=39152 RepID=A0A7J9NWD6_METMI|nr:hypothetical protein [Methanococcus maripaludis]MBA2851637.1 hypothetical protein [Methanococcus maripaludis]